MHYALALIALILISTLAIVGVSYLAHSAGKRLDPGLFKTFANIAEGTHEGGRISRFAEAALVRNTLWKKGTADNQVLTCGASDRPLGVGQDDRDAADAVEPVGLECLGAATRTLLAVCAENIACGVDLYTAANGEVQDLPTAAGTYYRVGYSITAGVADGLIEFVSCAPVAVTVTE